MKKIISLLLVMLPLNVAAFEVGDYEQDSLGYAAGTINIVGISGMSGDLIVEIGINGGEKLKFDINRTSDNIVTASITDQRYIENDTFMVLSTMAGAERRLRMFKVKGGQLISKRKKDRKITENYEHPDIVSLDEGETVEVRYNPTITVANNDGTISTKKNVEKTAKSVPPPTSTNPNPVGTEYNKSDKRLTILISEGTMMETIREYAQFYADTFNYKLIEMPGDDQVLSLPLGDDVAKIEDLYHSSRGKIRHIIFHNHTDPKLMRILPTIEVAQGKANTATVPLEEATPPPPSPISTKESNDQAPEQVQKPAKQTVRELFASLPQTSSLELIVMPGDDNTLNTTVSLDKVIQSIDDLYAATKGTIKHVVITPHNYRVIGH